jgi:hypothetical protein
MSTQHQDNSSSHGPAGQIWIRSGGKCECSSSCEHHAAGHCNIALLPEFWSARSILPAWIESEKNVLMREALCEACRVNPTMPDRVAEGSKRGDPNWWYRRGPRSQTFEGVIARPAFVLRTHRPKFSHPAQRLR